MAVTHPTAVRNDIADLVVDKIDAGASAGTLEYQTSGDVEVATCTFNDPAFDDAGSAGGNADGVSEANTISDDTNATGGTAAKARAFDSDSNQVFACSVTGTGGGGDIEISNTSVSPGETVSTTSLTYEAPN